MKSFYLTLWLLAICLSFTQCQKENINDRVKVGLTLQSSNGNPLSKVSVNIKTTTGNILVSELTDSLGRVEGEVPVNETFEVILNDPCGNAVYSKSISSVNQSTNLGVIKATTGSFQTISGKLVDCNGAAVRNGYASISLNGMLRYAAVDANGAFAVTFVGCGGTSSAHILGINESSLQKSPGSTLPITTSEMNVGTIQVCGSSIEQYLKYKLDGVDTELYRNTSKNDSIGGYSTMINGKGIVYISGGKAAANTDLLSCGTENVSAAGTFPLSSLNIKNYSNVVLIPPFNITFSKYAKSPGEFFEGSFAGKFTANGTSSQHDISASFKVMRIN